MGITAFVVLAILEIALAVRTCQKKPDGKTWRRDRLVVRAAEALSIVLHLVCSAAQKWRFVPVLAFLAILLVIAAFAMLIKRKGEDGPKKTAGAIVSASSDSGLPLYRLQRPAGIRRAHAWRDFRHPDRRIPDRPL